jgi:hypothetical protein
MKENDIRNKERESKNSFHRDLKVERMATAAIPKLGDTKLLYISMYFCLSSTNFVVEKFLEIFLLHLAQTSPFHAP